MDKSIKEGKEEGNKGIGSLQKALRHYGTKALSSLCN